MVLILRPDDEKIVSVSRKKVHCHEMAYAKFDHLTMTKPLTIFNDFTLSKLNVEEEIREAEKVRVEELKAQRKEQKIPKHVLSVKSLSDFKRNAEINTPIPLIAPPRQMKDAMEVQPPHLRSAIEHQRDHLII